MNHLINRDKKRRFLSTKYENTRRILKYIIYNRELPKYTQFSAIMKLNLLPRDSSKIRIRNRCILTGESHSVYSSFRLTRMKLRDYILNGFFSGITKSSW